VTTPEDLALSAIVNSHKIDPGDAHAVSALDPDNPPWGVWTALLTWSASVALIFIVPNLCVVPYIAYRYQGTRGLNEHVLMADRTLVLIFVSASLPTHLLTLVIVWAVITKLGRFSFRDAVGWRWSSDFGLLKSVGLGIFLFLAAWLAVGMFGAKPTDLDQIVQSSRAAALMIAFLAVATAPLVEETIYRGLLFPAMQRVTGRLSAVVIVASMFAALHIWQYRQSISIILSISLLSLVLTLVRARTGRLLPCFVIHLVYNGIQSVLIVLDPYLRALLQSWQHDAAPGMLTCLIRPFV